VITFLRKSPAIPARAGRRLGCCIFFGFLAASRAAAGDLNPFEAMAAGRARSNACGSEGLRIGSPGAGTAAILPDGTFRLEGVAVGVPVRAVETALCGGRSIFSAPVTLSAPDALALHVAVTLPGSGPPPVHALEVTGPAGEHTVVFPLVGRTIPLRVTAEDADGNPYGGVAGPLGSPSLQVLSSMPAVAAVNASAEVSSRAPGSTWVRVSGDGEWAQALIVVDTTLDTDGDGMTDSFESAHGLDPASPNDALADADLDGLSNLEEFRHGSDPQNPDTDEDLLLDFEEAARGTDPLNGDTDGDSTVDGTEVAQGTDPLNPNEKPGSNFVPSFKLSINLSSTALRAAVSKDDIVYLITSDGRLTSYSVDLVNFFMILQDVETLGADLRDIAVDGRTAYVAAGSNGLHVVDVTNPAVLTRTTTITGLGSVLGVAARSGLVYLATDSALRILRPGPGGSLVSAGSLAVPTFSRLALAGPYAFLGIPGINRLISVDVSDPAAPRELQRFAMPATTLPFREVAASGAFVYVAHGTTGLLAIRAEDPRALELIDTSANDLPGAAFDAVALLGNHVIGHTPAANGRAQIFRAGDDGRITWLQDVASNASGSLQVLLNQHYAIGLGATTFSISQVLERADRATTAPTGLLQITEGDDVLAPGGSATIMARAKDDIYLEQVEFFVDGDAVARDAFPPFRLRFHADPTRPPPYLLPVRAEGVDLRRNRAVLGAFLFRVERDLDGDGVPDPIDPDADGDEASDLEERYAGVDGYISDPFLPDTDGDGILDGEESVPGTDGYVTNASSPDTDGDGLTDSHEIETTHTDPTDPDTDDDGIPDGLEPGGALLPDPGEAAADGEGGAAGSVDAEPDPELRPSGDAAAGFVRPFVPDADGDGFDDDAERLLGTDPRVPTDFSKLDVTFRSATVTLRTPVAVKSLTLVDSVITLGDELGGGPGALRIEVKQTLAIAAGSRIDATAKGYASGTAPDGVASGSAGTGGSHGGTGGSRELAAAFERGGRPQESFDDPADPSDAGGGGSAGLHAGVGGGRGGRGGGVISIRAGALRLDGEISADGETAPGDGSGAGAGGAIRVECGSVRGNGRIHADGGAVLGGGGGGGGGRILVDSCDLRALDFRRVSACGGGPLDSGAPRRSTGGAGTIFIRCGSTGRELIVDNAGRRSQGTSTRIDGGALELARLTVRGAAVVECSGILELSSSRGPLRLSGGAVLHAGRIRLARSDELHVEDATLDADGLFPAGGRFDRLALVRASARIGSSVEARTLELQSSTLAVGGPIHAGDARLAGSILTVPNSVAGSSITLELAVDRTLEVDADSLVDLVGKGSLGERAGEISSDAGESAGKEPAAGRGAGGSHAGLGMLPELLGAAQAQPTYGAYRSHGSIENPRAPGGGGSAGRTADEASVPPAGGNGGGAARIRAASLVLEGRIDASGASTERSLPAGDLGGGAGAGGSVWITVGSLAGSGSVQAAGGSVAEAASALGAMGGAGGGGRIAVECDDVSRFTGSLRAPGGLLRSLAQATDTAAGAGTVFTRHLGGPLGSLTVDSEGRAPRGCVTRVEADAGETLHLMRLVVRSGARLSSARTIQVESLDAEFPDRLTIAGAIEAPRIELPETPFLDVAGGELDLGEIVAGGAGVGAVAVRSGGRLVLASPLAARSLAVTGESTITVPEPSAASTHTLDLSVAESIWIEQGSSIDLESRGYVGGGRGGSESEHGESADGAFPPARDGTGGAHGGRGGSPAETTGPDLEIALAYDDFTDPSRPGGGGCALPSSSARGGLGQNGGGLLRLRAAALRLDGGINLRGGGNRAGEFELEAGGGGAGGGALIEVETLAGSGEIDADGGSTLRGGGGGGGRVALRYADRSRFRGAVHARGGSALHGDAAATAGGAGTVFWKGRAQLFGDLIVENGGRTQSYPRTALRPVGEGRVASLGASELGASGIRFPVTDTRLEGRWLILDGAARRPLRIIANTETTLTIDPVAGDLTRIASVGSAFVGAIVLDSLTVANGGALSTGGDWIIIARGPVTVSGNGIIVAPRVVRW